MADLVLAAVHDAWDSAIDLQQRQLGALGGGFGGGLPAGLGDALGGGGGFDLSSLGLPGLGGPVGLMTTSTTMKMTRTTMTRTTKKKTSTTTTK